MWDHSGLVEWTDDRRAYLSVVFSWKVDEAYQRAVFYKALGYEVWVGGPAIMLNGHIFEGVADRIGGHMKGVLQRHNSDATYTTRGCVNKCKFCLVPKLEGDLVELPDSEWDPKPVICDNNLTAASIDHFAHVIERLNSAGIKGVDFNQGLDARLLTKEHAILLSKINSLSVVRLAWDSTRTEKHFINAIDCLVQSGITKNKIRVYMLVGFEDDPSDALYRAKKIKGLGLLPDPMRYQPLNAKVKNEYLSSKWNEIQMRDFIRFWYRQSWYEGIEFEDYDRSKHYYKHPTYQGQDVLL